MTLSGVILAAGLSRRMGFPKALLDWNGETYLDRLIRLFSSVCGQVIVVARPEGVAALEPCRRLDAVTLVLNPDAERGQFSSLQTGLAAVQNRDVLFTPVDYAHAAESTICAIAGAPPAPVVQPEYDGRHGHPVRIDREVYAALLAEPPTGDARSVVHRFPRLFLAVTDPGCVADADDPAAYAALCAASPVQ